MTTNSEEKARAWRAVLICPNPDLREAAEIALMGVELREVVLLSEYPAVCDTSSLVSDCQICFLDASWDFTTALRLLTRFARANISVIVLHPHPDADLTVECLRRGATDVMAFPGQKGQLQSILDHVAARRYYSSQPAPVAGAVYGVMAGKGASGSTTTATQLATRIAASRPRKTLLVDLDSISGSMAFLFRQTPTFSIVDLAADVTRIDEDLLKKMAVEVGPLDILFAPAKPTSLGIPVDEFVRIVEFWRSVYDCIILDLPSYYSPFSVEVARVTDLLMLVANCELSAIHCAVRTISYLETCGIKSSEIKVVINRYREAEFPAKSLETAFGRPVFGYICDAEKVLRRAVLDGVPVPIDSRYSCNIAEIAQRLTGWEIPTYRKTQEKLAPMRFVKKLRPGRLGRGREILSIRPTSF